MMLLVVQFLFNYGRYYHHISIFFQQWFGLKWVDRKKDCGGDNGRSLQTLELCPFIGKIKNES